jgi:hypothetical protein
VRIFLQIVDGELRASELDRDDAGEVVESWGALEDYLDRTASRRKIEFDDLKLVCSSTVDHPRDSTDDPKVIEMCKLLWS